MGKVIGYRELNPQQRIGGYHADLESLESYISFLTFPVYVSDNCNQGEARWFCVPASAVDKE